MPAAVSSRETEKVEEGKVRMSGLLLLSSSVGRGVREGVDGGQGSGDGGARGDGGGECGGVEKGVGGDGVDVDLEGAVVEGLWVSEGGCDGDVPGARVVDDYDGEC